MRNHLAFCGITVWLVAGCGPGQGSGPAGSTQSPPEEVQTCTEFFAGRTTEGPGTKGTLQTECLWKMKTLRVRFLEGETAVRAKVQKIAHEWSNHCSIKFVFVDDADAEIRIAFKKGKGSWSYVGKCQHDVPRNEPTMNFGWLTPSTSDTEYRRVVLHEFGHALGLVHEHQNPKSNPIKWNKEAVYQYYKRTENWDKAQVDKNIFKKYETNSTSSEYDSKSIMHYAIPQELTTDGYSVGWNTELSEIDKKFIRTTYP